MPELIKVLNQYLGENCEVVTSLIEQVKVYLQLECYSEAESQAKLAKKKDKDFETNKHIEIDLLIASAMLKQSKLKDSL